MDAWVLFVGLESFRALFICVGPFGVHVSLIIAQLSSADAASFLPAVPIILLALSILRNWKFIRLVSDDGAFVGVVVFPPLMTCEVVNREHSLGYTNYD